MQSFQTNNIHNCVRTPPPDGINTSTHIYTSTIIYTTSKLHILAMSCTHVYAVHHIALSSLGRLVNTIKIVRWCWCCFACIALLCLTANGILNRALLLGAPCCHCFGSPAARACGAHIAGGQLSVRHSRIRSTEPIHCFSFFSCVRNIRSRKRIIGHLSVLV